MLVGDVFGTSWEPIFAGWEALKLLRFQFLFVPSIQLFLFVFIKLFLMENKKTQLFLLIYFGRQYFFTCQILIFIYDLPDDNAVIFAASELISYCSFSSLILSSISFYILFKRVFLKFKGLSDARVGSITKKEYRFAVNF